MREANEWATMSRTDLESILADVDEPEETPDAPETMEREALPVTEPEADAGDEPGQTPQDGGDEEPSTAEASADEPDEQKQGLPPWMHARLKAKDDKIAAMEAKLRQLEAQPQPQPHQPAAPDPNMTVQSYVDQRTDDMGRQVAAEIRGMKLQVSRQIHEQQHGVEVVSQAVEWARDKQWSDPAFQQRALSAPDPIGFAMDEFRKEQVNQELAKYGGDLDKLIEARMAERASPGQGQSPPPQQQTPQPGPMPSDFSTTSSKRGSGRTATFSGPTPLSKLLDD